MPEAKDKDASLVSTKSQDIWLFASLSANSTPVIYAKITPAVINSGLAMDQEWKNQNQIPGENNTAQPPTSLQPAPNIAAPAAPIALSPASQQVNPGFSAPDTLAGGQNVYDQYNPGAAASRRKIVVFILVLALLAIPGGIGAYSFLGNKQPQKVANQTPASNSTTPAQPQITTQPVIENKKPAVPISWKPIDTKFGFTLKIPADWAASLSSEFDFNGLKTKSTTISDPKADTGTFISVGTQSRDTAKTLQEFESYLTSDQAYSDLGLDKSQVKLTSKKININGKEWLQIDTDVSGQLSRTIYLWDDDHAIDLAAVSNKQASLDELSEKYMLPMAASLELK